MAVLGVKTCIVDDCDKPARSKSADFCDKHYQRNRINGDPNTVRKTGRKPRSQPHLWLSEPSYNTLHKRLELVRGRAKNFTCVGCGQRAENWAYNHSGAKELTSTAKFPNGKTSTVTYSTDIDDYDPMCVACHGRRDYING